MDKVLLLNEILLFWWSGLLNINLHMNKDSLLYNTEGCRKSLEIEIDYEEQFLMKCMLNSFIISVIAIKCQFQYWGGGDFCTTKNVAYKQS